MIEVGSLFSGVFFLSSLGPMGVSETGFDNIRNYSDKDWASAVCKELEMNNNGIVSRGLHTYMAAKHTKLFLNKPAYL